MRILRDFPAGRITGGESADTSANCISLLPFAGLPDLLKNEKPDQKMKAQQSVMYLAASRPENKDVSINKKGSRRKAESNGRK